MSAKQLLIETMPVKFQIVEEASQKNGGRMKVKGVFAVANEVNGNGRVYREALLDREIAKLTALVERNRVFLEADHPEDGKSRIGNTVAILTGLKKESGDERKLYGGEAVILNTSRGRDLQEIIRAGGVIDISSRGWGTTAVDRWGEAQADIVQEDYQLKTFDFVVGGSAEGAELTSFTEQKREIINLMEITDAEIENNTRKSPEEKKPTKGGIEPMEILTVEALRKAYPDLVVKLEQEVTERVKADMTKLHEAEWEQAQKDYAENLKAEIEESEIWKEFKTFKEGKDASRAALIEIRKITEKLVGGVVLEPDPDEDKKKMEAIEKENAALKEENAAMKKKAADEAVAAETAKKVEQRITEVTAGKEHEKLLVERLTDCKTVEEVDSRLAREEAFIKKLVGEKKPSDLPKGEGKVLNENKEDSGGTLTDQQKRDRAIGGVDIDLKKKKAA